MPFVDLLLAGCAGDGQEGGGKTGMGATWASLVLRPGGGVAVGLGCWLLFSKTLQLQLGPWLRQPSRGGSAAPLGALWGGRV